MSRSLVDLPITGKNSLTPFAPSSDSPLALIDEISMAPNRTRSLQMPRREELGLFAISNGSGLSISALPNGTLFAIEYADDKGAVQINQIQGSPLIGGIGRLYLRVGGARPDVVEIVGPRADGSFAYDATSFSWSGKTGDIAYDVRLALHPSETAWFWRASIRHLKEGTLPADLVLIQDVGLGDRGFLMNSEAYASQYVDHHIADHKAYGCVVINRQNLKQSGGRNPWLAQGCLDGAVAYATDAIQLVQAKDRLDDLLVGTFGTRLPSERRQQETACPAIPIEIAVGHTSWRDGEFLCPVCRRSSRGIERGRPFAARRHRAAGRCRRSSGDGGTGSQPAPGRASAGGRDAR